MQIPSVYEVTLPSDVRAALDEFSIYVTLFLYEVGTPLTCIGLGGYLPKLIFFMLAPALVCLLALVCAVSHLALTEEPTRVRVQATHSAQIPAQSVLSGSDHSKAVALRVLQVRVKQRLVEYVFPAICQVIGPPA